jgi:uncharacterized membrane protein YvlD (DUF360 family)
MIIGLIVNTLAFIAIAEFLPGFRIRSHGTAFVIALLYAVLHVVTWWVLAATIIAALTALFIAVPPLGFLAGLASLIALPLITFFVSVFALTLTDKLVDGLAIDSWKSTILAAILLAVINALTGAMFGI